MIARLLGAGSSLFVHFCAATLIAELIIFGYVWSTWQLDSSKLIQILAFAQGIQLPAMQQKDGTGLDEVSPEQVSYEQILKRRSVEVRHLELRELALANALDQLKSQQRQLTEQREQQRKHVEQVEARLKALKEGAQAEGREVVRRTLESIKPDQAKEQLFQMLQKEEMDEVVLLLSEMSDTKRAKILAEFKTPEDNQKLAEVLRLIRTGEPESSLIDEAMDKLEQHDLSGA